MEVTLQEDACSTKNAAPSASEKYEMLRFYYTEAKSKCVNLETRNRVLISDVAKLKEETRKWGNLALRWRSCYDEVKKGRDPADLECVCKDVTVVGLKKKIAMLEEEKRNLILRSSDKLLELKTVAANGFREANEKVLKYKHLVEKQEVELQTLREEKKKFRALIVESNQRVVKMQRERTVESNKYTDMEGKSETQNSKIEDLNRMVMALQAEKQNNLATIARLHEKVSQSKDENYLTNIVAVSKNKAANLESEILQLKSKLIEVNEELGQCSNLRSIEIQSLNEEITALKLAEEKNQGEILQLKQDLNEVNKENFGLKLKFSQCKVLLDKQCTEVDKFKEKIKGLKLDKQNNMDEIAKLKSALLEVEGKCAKYITSENAKDTEINQLQNKINMMQSEATQEIEKATKKRPLKMRDTRTVACTTKKIKSLHSSGGAVTSNDNNEVLEYAGNCDKFSNLEPEEDSCDSISSCDVFSLFNSNRNRWMALCRDPVTPLDDCSSTQTDACIVANSSVQTDNISNSNIMNTYVQTDICDVSDLCDGPTSFLAPVTQTPTCVPTSEKICNTESLISTFSHLNSVFTTDCASFLDITSVNGNLSNVISDTVLLNVTAANTDNMGEVTEKLMLDNNSDKSDLDELIIDDSECNDMEENNKDVQNAQATITSQETGVIAYSIPMSMVGSISLTDGSDVNVEEVENTQTIQNKTCDNYGKDGLHVLNNVCDGQSDERTGDALMLETENVMFDFKLNIDIKEKLPKMDITPKVDKKEKLPMTDLPFKSVAKTNKKTRSSDDIPLAVRLRSPLRRSEQSSAFKKQIKLTKTYDSRISQYNLKRAHLNSPKTIENVSSVIDTRAELVMSDNVNLSNNKLVTHDMMLRNRSRRTKSEKLGVVQNKKCKTYSGQHDTLLYVSPEPMCSDSVISPNEVKCETNRVRYSMRLKSRAKSLGPVLNKSVKDNSFEKLNNINDIMKQSHHASQKRMRSATYMTLRSAVVSGKLNEVSQRRTALRDLPSRRASSASIACNRLTGKNLPEIANGNKGTILYNATYSNDEEKNSGRCLRSQKKFPKLVDNKSQEHVDQNYTESSALTVKKISKKKNTKSEGQKQLKKVISPIVNGGEIFSQLYSMHPRVHIIKLDKNKISETLLSTDKQSTEDKNLLEECFDDKAYTSKVTEFSVTVTEAERNGEIFTSETEKNIEKNSENTRTDLNGSDTFSKLENNGNSDVYEIISSSNSVAKKLDNEMLSSSNTGIAKESTEECSGIFCSTEEVTRETKFGTRTESPDHFLHNSSVTQVNKNITASLKNFDVEIKVEDKIASTIHSEMNKNSAATGIYTDGNRIPKSLGVSEILVMESEQTSVPTGRFGMQTSEIASDNISTITKGPMKTSFCTGDKTTENKALKPVKVISPDKKFNIETPAHNHALSVISSRVREDKVKTTQTNVRNKNLDVEEDKNPTVVRLESKGEIVTAENSKVVSETPGKKVAQLVVPQNYTLPNAKPKRVAHVPNPSSKFLSDGLYIARIPCDSSFTSNKGSKKIQKSSKLQSIKKRISKTCISFKNSSEKTPVLNNQVTQKTAALTQHLNMLETITLNKPCHQEMLQKNTQCNISDVREKNNCRQLPTQQLSCLPETTMQTRVPGLFEDFPDQYELNQAQPFEPYESKMATHSFKEKSDELSFNYISQPNKHIKKYGEKMPKHESNIVSLQKTEEPKCEALNLCNDRSKSSAGTVSDVKDQKRLNYTTLPTVNVTEKSDLDSTLNVDHLVSHIHNDPINVSKKNIFQIPQTKESVITIVPASSIRSQTSNCKSVLLKSGHHHFSESECEYKKNVFQSTSTNESISTVPASYIRSETTSKKSQAFDSKSVSLNNSQSCNFSESKCKSEKNAFQISKTKESLLTKVPVSYCKLESVCRKSVISDNTSAILTNLQSGNFSGSDCMSWDMKSCKEFEKQNSPVLKKPILSGSENISKDVDKQVPVKFSFYTSSANTGEYDDMNTSPEGSEPESSGNFKKEAPTPYVRTVFNEAYDPHKKNEDCSLKAETHHVTSVSSAKRISSFRKSQEVSRVSQLSREEMLRQNCDILLKFLSKNKNRMKTYNSSKRLIKNRKSVLDITTVLKTFNKLCQPNANNQDVLRRLEHIHPEVLLPLTIKLLEGPDYREVWYDICTFYLKWRKNDVPRLLDYIHQRLMKFRRPPLMLFVVKNLSSFYVKLSLKANEYSRLEALAIDSLYCMQHATDVVIGEILKAHPASLPPPSVTNNDPWVLVLVHSVFNVSVKYLEKNPLVNVEDIKKRLETVHGYKRGQHSFHDIVKILFGKLKANNFNRLESSFLILSKRVQWFHSYTYIIQREMFPIIDAWIKGDHVLSDEAMAMLIRLVGFMARGSDIKNNKEQNQAITRKLQRLCNVSIMPQIVAKALFSALVSHGRQDFDGVLDCVLNWKWGLDNLDRSIRSFLTYKPEKYWEEKLQVPQGNVCMTECKV